jgi:hypothetical protein
MTNLAFIYAGDISVLCGRYSWRVAHFRYLDTTLLVKPGSPISGSLTRQLT